MLNIVRQICVVLMIMSPGAVLAQIAPPEPPVVGPGGVVEAAPGPQPAVAPLAPVPIPAPDSGAVTQVPDAEEGASESPAPEAAAGEATEEAGPAFDITPFLTAMVELRGAALTCEPFVGDNPTARTEGVVQFFAQLNQQLPELANETTQSSLKRFIGSQAAVLCQDMLNVAFVKYGVNAAYYQSEKPEQWPAAPAMQPGQWCSLDFCLDR